MKNLWKVADETTNAQFIWQNSNGEIKNDLPPEALLLKKDTQERLVALKKGIAKEKQMASKVKLAADTSMDIVTGLLSDGDVSEKDINKIANISKKKIGVNELNNLYRTEFVAQLNSYLELKTNNISPEDASRILLKAMEEASFPDNWPLGDVWKNGKIVQKGKLYYAMRMVRYGESKLTPEMLQKFRGTNRNTLAKEMNGPQLELDNSGTLNFGGKTYVIDNVELLIGAAMTKINSKFLSGFNLENTMIVDGPNGPQLIATMENGCKGNFVIIDLKEGGETVEHPEGCINGFKWVFNMDENGNPYNYHQVPCGDGPGPSPVIENDCIDCKTLQSGTSADVTSEMFEGNFLLGNNPCNNPLFEQNFAKMEELGIFNAALINKATNWNSLNSREKWNSMSADDQKMAVTQYQHEIASEGLTRVEKFFNAVFEENGMKDKLEGVQNGRLLEGGVIGWLEQIPKIFQNKDKATERRIKRKLGISQADYDLMMEQGAADIAESTNRGRHTMEELQTKLDAMSPKKREKYIANARKNAERMGALTTFDKAMRGGSLYQAKKMLLPDMLVLTTSFLTGNPDIVLTNIRLPRWLGTKIQQLPGLNAIARTELDNKIGNNYTRLQQEVIANLDKEIQLTDNVAQLSADLMRNIALLEYLNDCDPKDSEMISKVNAKVDKQNARLDILVQNMEETIEKLITAVEKREQAWKNESKSTRRHNYKFLENTEGRRKETRQKVKEIRKALRESKGDKFKLTSPEVMSAMETVQKNLLAEINDDFGSNVDFAGFGKKITNAESFELNIKRNLARNLSVKVNVEKFDNNNNKIPKEPLKEWQEAEGKVELVINWESIKFGRKSWSKLEKNQQNKVERLVNKYIQDFQDRMSEVKELHGISTVINEYSKATNVRRVRSKVYSMEENYNALDNVKESSSYATLMRIERDTTTREALLGVKCAENNCWFDAKIRGKLKTFFNIDEAVDPEGKLAAFQELKAAGFEKQYNDMIQKVGKFIKNIERDVNVETGLGEYIVYLENGNICEPKDVANVLKKGEIVYIYDNVTGEIQKRFPITPGIIIQIGKKVIPNEKLIGKDSQIIAANDNLGHSGTLDWLQTQSQYADLGITNYAIETTADGTAITGVRLMMEDGLERVFEFSLQQSLKSLTQAGIASLIGQALENNNYRTTYPMRDVNDYSNNRNPITKSREKRRIVIKDGKKFVKTANKDGEITYQEYKTQKEKSKKEVEIPANSTVETNSDLMSQFGALSGNGDAIRNFAEKYPDMFSTQVLEDIRNFPINSIVSMSKILTDSNGKIIELTSKVDCTKCRPVNGKTVSSYEIKNGTKIPAKNEDTEINDDYEKNVKSKITEKAPEYVETYSKTIGEYIELPDNAVSITEGQDGEIYVKLSNGKTIETVYKPTRDLKKKFVKPN